MENIKEALDLAVNNATVTNLKVLQKLFQARAIIKEMDVKKKGYNEYSKYEYFLPEQISQIVFEACKKVNIINIFNLSRNTTGLIGTLTVIDLDSGEFIDFKLPTDIPDIKATNTTQQIGGCATFTERYLLMIAYDIKDNSLDFDSQDNRNVDSKEQNKKFTSNKPVMTYAVMDKYLQRIREGEFGKGEEAFNKFIEKLKGSFVVSNEIANVLRKEF